MKKRILLFALAIYFLIGLGISIYTAALTANINPGINMAEVYVRNLPLQLIIILFWPLFLGWKEIFRI